MSKSFALLLVLLSFAVQLFVSARMIYNQEETLKSGTAYKFKTWPIDPSDPFRGKYIVLNHTVRSFETNENWSDYKGKVYVYLKTDTTGFAAIKTVSRDPLPIPEDYVIAQSNYNYGKRVNFTLPFNRFYMNEHKAYDAERTMGLVQGDTTKICYGLVSIKNGTAVLRNVFIDDIPIQQYVENVQTKIE